MIDEKPIDRLKRKYYLRLLDQRRSLEKVLEEVQENIRQIDKEIGHVKIYGFESVARGRSEERSYFHLEKPAKEKTVQEKGF